MVRWKTATFAQALKASKGMVYVAATQLGCSPNTIKKRIAQVPALRELVEQEDGHVTDVAELKLFAAILAGEPWAVQYRLTRKGKDRGYAERQEITGAEGGAIRADVRRLEIPAATVEEAIRILVEVGAIHHAELPERANINGDERDGHESSGSVEVESV